MTYTSKYYFQFNDHPRNNNTWRVDFLDPQYTGESQPLLCSGNPITFNGEGADTNRFTPIKAKSVTIEIISQIYRQYYDIFNNRAYPIHCKIQKNGNLVFWGIVDPEEYSEDVRNSAHVVAITAVDGLSMLKNMEYIPTRESGNLANYGINSWLNIIFNCVNRLGFYLPVVDCSYLYHETADDSISCLGQHYHLWAAFRSDSGYMNCYDVLQKVIFELFSRITQSYIEGVGLCWLIEPIDILNEEHTGFILSATAPHAQTGTIDAHSFVSIIGHDNSFIDLSAIAQIDAAPGKLEVKGDIGFTDKLIKDHYDYTTYQVTATVDKEKQIITVTPIPRGSILTFKQGVRFNLGHANWTRFNLDINLVLFGMTQVDIFLVLYRDDGSRIYANENSDWPSGNPRPLHSQLAPHPFDTPEVEHDNMPGYAYKFEIQKTINWNPFPPEEKTTPNYFIGRLMLIIRPRVVMDRMLLFNGNLIIDLQNSNVTATLMSLGELGAEIQNTDTILTKGYSSNYKIISVDLPFLNTFSFVWSNFTRSLEYLEKRIVGPSYFFTNSILVIATDSYPVYSVTNALRFPLSFHIAGNSESNSYIGLFLAVYDKIYSTDRTYISGKMVGQFDYNTILILAGKAYIIDKWTFNVKEGLHDVILLEIGQHEDYLITEESSAEFIITESDGDYIDIDI